MRSRSEAWAMTRCPRRHSKPTRRAVVWTGDKSSGTGEHAPKLNATHASPCQQVAARRADGIRPSGQPPAEVSFTDQGRPRRSDLNALG
jgi:hypothetical protein